VNPKRFPLKKQANQKIEYLRVWVQKLQGRRGKGIAGGSLGEKRGMRRET